MTTTNDPTTQQPAGANAGTPDAQANAPAPAPDPAATKNAVPVGTEPKQEQDSANAPDEIPFGNAQGTIPSSGFLGGQADLTRPAPVQGAFPAASKNAVVASLGMVVEAMANNMAPALQSELEDSWNNRWNQEQRDTVVSTLHDACYLVIAQLAKAPANFIDEGRREIEEQLTAVAGKPDAHYVIRHFWYVVGHYTKVALATVLVAV